MSKLDIIIPAYKCGSTIGRTLKSLDIQTNRNFNLTIVLDGYDEVLCYLCCNNLPQINGKAKVLTPEHKGVGPTRNYGIEETNAEYIMFLDADDLLMPHAVQTIYNAIDNGGFDYGIGKTMREAPDGNFETVGSSQVTWIHGRTYRREFLNKYGIRFPALTMCEDLTFNMLCSEFAERIPETQSAIHIQRYTKGSASRNSKSSHTQATTYIQSCIEYLDHATRFKQPDDCMLLPAALAACYWYLDGAQTAFPNDNDVLDTMARQFVELLDKSGYSTSERLQRAMPQALQIPVRPFNVVMPQTMTFEQEIIYALGRVANGNRR